MATQGLVTVKKNGLVALKIVVGDNGANAKKFADAIRARGVTPSLEDTYTFALANGFGCWRCLVVVDPQDILFKGGGDNSQLGSLYRDTFNQPEFNPRWSQGIADYVEIVEF